MLLQDFSRPDGTDLNADCKNCHGFDMDGDTGEPLCHEFRIRSEKTEVGLVRDFELYVLFGDRPKCPFRVKDYYADE